MFAAGCASSIFTYYITAYRKKSTFIHNYF